MECPNCKSELQSGYGMAGGGCGPYFFCEECDYFEKFQDPEMGAELLNDKQGDVPSRG